MLFTCFTYEKPTNMKLEWYTIGTQMVKLKKALLSPTVWKPCLLIFIMFSAPNADQGFFYFLTNHLEIEPSFLGLLTAIYGVAGIISAIIFNLLLYGFPFKRMYLIFGLASPILGLLSLFIICRVNTSLGISDKAFLISAQLIQSLFDNILRLLILVFAARVCPKNIEGTLFATIMGIWNFAYLISNYLGALLLHSMGITDTSFQNLWLAILISKILFILPIIFIKFIPDKLEDTEEVHDYTFYPIDEDFVEMSQFKK